MNDANNLRIRQLQFLIIKEIISTLPDDPKGVVIIDIDDTIAYTPTGRPLSEAILINGVLELSQFIVSKFNIIFVTGRNILHKDITIQLLQPIKQLLNQPIILYMLKSSYADVYKGKKEIRDNIARDYNIVLNIGDQVSDLDSKYESFLIWNNRYKIQ